MLAYIDESGLPNPNDSCTRPVLAAMCVTEDVDRHLTETLFRYKNALIGKNLELKGTKAPCAEGILGQVLLQMVTEERACRARV